MGNYIVSGWNLNREAGENIIKRPFLLINILFCLVSGCAPALPVWRQDARVVFERARMNGADKLLPDECRSVGETLLLGESLLQDDEPEEADKYFHLAWTKGKLLEVDLLKEKFRLAYIARLKEAAEQRERERQQALQEEHNRLLREQAAATEAAEREKKAKPNKEKPLPDYHTVLRGETLPQIAAQADVYGDQNLWPLLYRANRDQISDPGHIRPGQILRIPRNVSKEEIAEARRYSQEKPLR